MAFFDTLQNRIRNHARYARTRHELETLPFSVKVDLGLNGAEDAVARKAVYG